MLRLFNCSRSSGAAVWSRRSYFLFERSGEISYLSGKLPGKLAEELVEEIKTLDEDASLELVSEVIKKICSDRPLRAREIARLLKKNMGHVKNYYLTPMLESQDLELLYPDNPTHPNQAYITKKKIRKRASK